MEINDSLRVHRLINDNYSMQCIHMNTCLESQGLSDLIERCFEPQNEEGVFKTFNKQLRGRIKRLLAQFIKLLMILFLKRCQMLPLQSKHGRFLKIHTKVRKILKKFISIFERRIWSPINEGIWISSRLLSWVLMVTKMYGQ